MSQLEKAELSIQKLALMSCIEDSLVMRVEAQLELCVDTAELMEVLEKEIKLRNPRIVARFKWMKAK